jgi:hypothetical protein
MTCPRCRYVLEPRCPSCTALVCGCGEGPMRLHWTAQGRSYRGGLKARRR